MKIINQSNVNPRGRSLHEKAQDIVIEERQLDILLKKKLVNFYIGKDVFCISMLLLMFLLALSGHVPIPMFIVSQIINAIVRGTGKGLNRVTASLFARKE
jgi:hypothetical protein